MAVCRPTFDPCPPPAVHALNSSLAIVFVLQQRNIRTTIIHYDSRIPRRWEDVGDAGTVSGFKHPRKIRVENDKHRKIFVRQNRQITR